MAVDANRRIAHSVLDRLAVHTLIQLPRDFLVALGPCARDFPVIDFGSLIGGGINVMTAVATGTGCRILAERDRSGVNALLTGIGRMRHRNLVPRQKSGIAMAVGARVRLILPSNRRVG